MVEIVKAAITYYYDNDGNQVGYVFYCSGVNGTKCKGADLYDNGTYKMYCKPDLTCSSCKDGTVPCTISEWNFP